MSLVVGRSVLDQVGRLCERKSVGSMVSSITTKKCSGVKDFGTIQWKKTEVLSFNHF